MGRGVQLKVLFIVPYTPTQIRTRPLNLIRALRSNGHDVTVATVWTGEQERRSLDELGREVGQVVAEHLPLARSAWNCLGALAGAEPLQARYSWSPALARRLRDLVEQMSFDAVHVEHLRGVRYGLMLADQLSYRASRPALVWDSVDCISLLFRRALSETEMPRARLAARVDLRRTERFEGEVAKRFDRVIVTSEVDRDALLELGRTNPGRGPAASVDVVPNGVDLEYFSPPIEPRAPLTIVMTGKMSYHANVTAVRWLVERVMPDVWSVVPAARLWIVGKDPTHDVHALGEAWTNANPDGQVPGGRVLVTGTVPDVRPFLHKASVAVAPIRYGVGIQNKVLEAMACGTPVVATAEAVAGVRARHGDDLLVASTPGEFAHQVIALLQDSTLGVRLGAAGRAFVERQHDWRRAGAILADIYRHARH